MKSKKDMDTLQLDAYYNDLYLLEIKRINKDNPIAICLCKKCRRYITMPLILLEANEAECKYCNNLNNFNDTMQDWKNKTREELKKIFENLKMTYQNNAKKETQDITKQIKEKNQIRLLQEMKENHISLTKEQKRYLKEYYDLHRGSKGEQKIATILNINNLPFTKEKTFNNLFYPETGRKPRFDFYVNNEYLIEFDGEQHFKESKGAFKKSISLEEQQKRDKYKNQYCKDNNIPLIRIPYTHYDNLCIEDLLLETTNFRTV